MFRSNVAFLTCLAVIALQAFDWRRSNAQGDPRLQRPAAQTPKTNQYKRDFSIRTIPRNSIGHRCSGYGCYCNNNQEVVWRDQIDSQVEILVNGKVVGKALASGTHPQATNIVFPAYGTEYEIRVSSMKRFWNARMKSGFKTLAPERRLFDIEVDGLSVMNGKPRAGRPHGYVVKAGRSTTIRGWRIDDQAVRRFVVARPVESVAAAENTMNQIGNIKVRVYRERPLPITFYGGLKTGGAFSTKRPVGGNQRANQFGSGLLSFSAAGTGAGSQAQSQIRRVSFELSPWPIQTIEFTYIVDEG